VEWIHLAQDQALCEYGNEPLPSTEKICRTVSDCQLFKKESAELTVLLPWQQERRAGGRNTALLCKRHEASQITLPVFRCLLLVPEAACSRTAGDCRRDVTQHPVC
jgi:hypothetical protein